MSKLKLFTTGEFAKLCDTTKDTLFHYDDIGLLKPETVAANGYRYYTLKQIYIFNLIRTLIDCDASLSEIKDYFSMTNPDEIKDFISQKKRILEDQITTLNQALGFLNQADKAADYMNESENYFYDTPRIIDREEKYMIVTAASKDIRLSSKENAAVLHNHFSYCDNILKINKFPVGRIINKSTLFSGELFYSYVFSLTPVKYEDKRSVIKPAGRYVHIFHHGDYSTIGASYQKLLDFCIKNHLSITGNAYELEANNFIMKRNGQNQIIGIMIQID
ncbi:MAG: MerR family transcriptional regulator [Eubacterium sp.]|nr:MerR family transcriptional regulator [Eubacterium sp.]